MRITAIDHVQVAVPTGGEDRARAFYGKLLGLREVPKPSDRAERGGAWFEECGVRVHVGIDDDFRPARKAHPALSVDDLTELVASLRQAGVVVDDSASIGQVSPALPKRKCSHNTAADV